MKNPFEFGRELGSDDLVDREHELETVMQAMTDGGRLFLIGPRRYGKTSILRVASERARSKGMVVLRHNAEAYPTLARLGQAILEEAATQLVGTSKRAAGKIQAFFGALRPQIAFNPLDQSYSIMVTTSAPATGTGEALLAEVLDGLDRLAADSGRRVVVVIDEFQQIVEAGGIPAEAQIRAAVQRHDHLSYVFAGSKTSMLTQMTGDRDRPFYRLGARLFVGPVPRKDFAPFLRAGFERSGFSIPDDAVTAILDRAADVPYNVQRLAHACWNYARDRSGAEAPTVTADIVDFVLDEVVRRDDPFYSQTWNRLAITQQKALLATVHSSGQGLFAGAVLKQSGLAMSTMRTALEALVRVGVLRENEIGPSVQYVLEDPFMGSWVRLFVVQN